MESSSLIEIEFLATQKGFVELIEILKVVEPEAIKTIRASIQEKV